MGKSEDKWNANYDALKAFVETYRHLPNKKKVAYLSLSYENVE